MVKGSDLAIAPLEGGPSAVARTPGSHPNQFTTRACPPSPPAAAAHGQAQPSRSAGRARRSFFPSLSPLCFPQHRYLPSKPAVLSNSPQPEAHLHIIHIQVNQQPSPTARGGAFCKTLKRQQHPVPYQLHSKAWLPKHTNLQASVQKPIACHPKNPKIGHRPKNHHQNSIAPPSIISTRTLAHYSTSPSRPALAQPAPAGPA